MGAKELLQEEVLSAVMEVYESDDRFVSKDINYKGPLPKTDLGASRAEFPLAVKLHQRYETAFSYTYYFNVYGVQHIWYIITQQLQIPVEPWTESRRVRVCC